MRRVTLKLIIPFAVIILAICSMEVQAAGPPGPPGGGGDPPCWPPPCIPIDGGIGFLLAAGLAYGGKKALGSFKKEK
ncbi:MAG TPA: hypothetical protein EYN69_05375 [Flavobacteriales bacterium]|nr:hypothetical protein [Flavobacteriales bacterium]